MCCSELANEAVYSGFPNSEKTVLRLLASGQSLFGTAADLLGVSRGGAQNARANLVSSGDVIDSQGRLQVADPVLADWIRRRLPDPCGAIGWSAASLTLAVEEAADGGGRRDRLGR